MQTMKKEDMEKEQKEIVWSIGLAVFNALRPVTRLISAVGRVDFLSNEIDKVTPKPAPVTVVPEEKKDV